MLIPFDKLTSKYKFKPNGILHIGASEGQEADAYEKLGVKYVLWIEAIPYVYGKLLENIEYRRNGTIHDSMNICVSDKEGPSKFNVANNEGQSSSLLEFGTHSQVHPEVKFLYQGYVYTNRLDKVDFSELLFDFRDLDFLNIDIQGAELMALKGMGKLLDQFKYAYLEINERELYKGCALLPELNNFMKDKGFQFKEKKMCGSNFWGDAFFMR